EELFCYLLLRRAYCHPREILADLFWGDNPTSLSKKYLRKALWQLQESLEAQPASPATGLLLVEPEWVQLNPNGDLWLDVAAFEDAYRQVQELPAQALTRQQIQSLQEAVSLYRGELLEGWYQDWCLYERERLRYMYLAMLDKLMNCCELRREYETGIVYGLRILRADPAQERTHRELMRLHYLAGNRTAALRQYERCVVALREELGVPPAQATEALCQQIRADHLDEAPEPLEQASRVNLTTLTNAAMLLEHLKQLRVELVNLQDWAQQGIEALEQVLTGPQ
ncbi:MAG TPA: bacterial transcriptional activator domain-containing protein, partial [Caldilineaceae bacterium]|nr:bacterial transcriptional activator domain-containing protein [Caldilineaceae bacterium]